VRPGNKAKIKKHRVYGEMPDFGGKVALLPFKEDNCWSYKVEGYKYQVLVNEANLEELHALPK